MCPRCPNWDDRRHRLHLRVHHHHRVLLTAPPLCRPADQTHVKTRSREHTTCCARVTHIHTPGICLKRCVCVRDIMSDLWPCSSLPPIIHPSSLSQSSPFTSSSPSLSSPSSPGNHGNAPHTEVLTYLHTFQRTFLFLYLCTN